MYRKGLSAVALTLVQVERRELSDWWYNWHIPFFGTADTGLGAVPKNVVFQGSFLPIFRLNAAFDLSFDYVGVRISMTCFLWDGGKGSEVANDVKRKGRGSWRSVGNFQKE